MQKKRNNMISLKVVALLLLPFAHITYAQDESLDSIKSSLKNPVISRMPDRAAWLLSISENKKEGTGGASPKVKTAAKIYKDKDNYLIEYSPSMNGVDQLWIFDGIAYIMGKKINGAMMVNKMQYPFSSFGSSDFDHFSWIKSKHLVEVKKVRGGIVGYFKAPLSETMTISDQLKLEELNNEREFETIEVYDDDGALIETKEADLQPLTFEDIAGEGFVIAAVDLKNQRPLFMKSKAETISVKPLSSTRALTPPREVNEYLERQAKKLKRLRASGGRR